MSKEKNKWVKVEGHPMDMMEEDMKKHFSSTLFVSELVDMLFSYLIVLAIEQPLLALAHLIRTLEIGYEFNILVYALFLLMISMGLLVLYSLSRKLRKTIELSIEHSRRSFVSNLLSYVFGIFFLDIIIEPIFALSNFIILGDFVLDVGFLVDKIMSGVLLIGIYFVIVGIRKVIYEKTSL